MTFSEAVDVTGAPQLELQIGNDARQAAYSSGDGSAALVFSYTVVENDVDTDGIAVGANKLVLNGGTVAAVSGGLAANLAHGAEAADVGPQGRRRAADAGEREELWPTPHGNLDV